MSRPATKTNQNADHGRAIGSIDSRQALQRGVLLAICAACVYLLIVGSFCFDFKQTNYPHHILMADAMLHGQLDIRPEALEPLAERFRADLEQELQAIAQATGHDLRPEEMASIVQPRVAGKLAADWAVVGDRVYGYWAPLTPVLMMPFVAVFGVGVSDQVINVFFGALNVGLFYWLLRRVHRSGLCRMDDTLRTGLTLLLAFGTSHFWLTCTAQVWFAVQIVTLTALLAAMIATCGSSSRVWQWLLGGFFFGAAILGRNIVGLVLPFFLLLIWQRARDANEHRWRAFLCRALAFGLPVALAVGAQGMYNAARFGDPLNGGLSVQVKTGGHSHFREAYDRYGTFSLHHVLHNARYYLWNWHLPRLADGRLWFDSEGNSMFLVTPPLLYLFLIWRRRTLFTAALLAGAVPMLAVLLSYFATGCVQFGPRYLLDVMPLLLLLVASGMRGRLSELGFVLIVLACAANLFGTYRMCDAEFVLIRAWAAWWMLPALVAVVLLAGLGVRLRNRRPAA